MSGRRAMALSLPVLLRPLFGALCAPRRGDPVFVQGAWIDWSRRRILDAAPAPWYPLASRTPTRRKQHQGGRTSSCTLLRSCNAHLHRAGTGAMMVALVQGDTLRLLPGSAY